MILHKFPADDSGRATRPQVRLATNSAEWRTTLRAEYKLARRLGMSEQRARIYLVGFAVVVGHTSPLFVRPRQRVAS